MTPSEAPARRSRALHHPVAQGRAEDAEPGSGAGGKRASPRAGRMRSGAVPPLRDRRPPRPRPRAPGGLAGAARPSPPAHAPASGGVWAGLLRPEPEAARRTSRAENAPPACSPARPAGRPPVSRAKIPSAWASGHRGTPRVAPPPPSPDASSAHSSSCPRAQGEGWRRPNRFARHLAAPRGRHTRLPAE